MTDLEQLREDIEVCSRAALTPAPKTSAAPALPGAAGDAPRPHAPCPGAGLNFWDDARDYRGCLLWMLDTGRINCCYVGDYAEDPGAFTEEFVLWQELGKPRRPLR